MRSTELRLDRAEELVAEHRMLPDGGVVLCAVSGGADSVCLLHWLWHNRERYRIRVAAAHYNHQMRGEESQRDEDFVRDLTGRLGIPLVVGRGDVARAARDAGRGLEETARDLRYRFLEQTAAERGALVIATAHNANDNAETVLMHLLRGSGLRGLTGIPPVRGMLIRPLLTTKRDIIEQYNKRHSIPWVTDSTNADQSYTRNRIRGQLLPLLEELGPGAAERLGETARRLRGDEDYLTAQAQALLGNSARRIPVEVLAAAPEPIALRAVRLLIGGLRTGNDNCTAAHLRSVLDLCRGDNPSAHVDLPGGLLVRREYGELVFTAQEDWSLKGSTSLELPGTTRAGVYELTCRSVIYQGEPQTPYRFYLAAQSLQARRRRTGDVLKRPGRHGKAVKKLLIDEKIPLHLRDSLPVLEVGDRVAAVVGLGPDIAFAPAPGESAWEITITPPDRAR